MTDQNGWYNFLFNRPDPGRPAAPQQGPLTRTPSSFEEYAAAGNGRPRSFGRYGSFHTLYGSRPRVPVLSDAARHAGDLMQQGEKRVAERSGLFGAPHETLSEAAAKPEDAPPLNRDGTIPKDHPVWGVAPGESDAGLGIEDASYQLTPEAQAAAEARTTPTASAHYRTNGNERTSDVRFDPAPVTPLSDRAPLDPPTPIPFSNDDPAWAAARAHSQDRIEAERAYYNQPAQRLAGALFNLIFSPRRTGEKNAGSP